MIGGWSPDGELIVYRSHGIATVRVRDGVVRRLTRGVNDIDPSWSHDGTEVVFSRNAYGDPRGGNGIWIVDRDGSAVHRVAALLRTYEYYRPTWAPR